MELPFFSIVIPTRNRYETLQYTLCTVIRQKFTDFELIISDNSDEESLGELSMIDAYLEDERVKYYRPPSVLAMVDHWEFAVSKAAGRYIIVFGDDDGLVEDALTYLFDIIEKTQTELVSWARVEYSWPDRKPENYANLIIVPYMARTGVVNSISYIKDVISANADYRYLPMFYNSAVSSRLVKLLKEKTGRVFGASSPDIYTGYSFAYLTKEYLTVGYPLSINGVSSKSNGAAHLNAKGNTAIQDDYSKLLKVATIKWPSELPEVFTSYFGIIEPFIQLSGYFPELKTYITRKKIYQLAIDNLESSSEEDLKKKIGKIIDSTKDDLSLHKWVVSYIDKVNPIVKGQDIGVYQNKVGFDGSHLTLDGSRFGLNNVYDVSVFIRNIFGNIKDQEYLKPVKMPLLRRIRKAAGILLRPS
ncbi:MAG TPA: glycosyltransferase [Puia sp.]|nr:glycosyltransferase [Puia sp.]